MTTKFRQAVERIGGLSTPSKMPCSSWSIPASTCQTGGKLRNAKGSVCSICYAESGTYNFRATKVAMIRRFAILKTALENPDKANQFVTDFSYVLNIRANRKNRKADNKVFRWHDSGDLQGLTHLKIIVRIAEACPTVTFWLPTREAGYIRSYLENGGLIPSNLFVKISLPRVDQFVIPPAYKKIAELSNQISFTAVYTDLVINQFNQCNAERNNNQCGDCRECWSNTNVTYKFH